MTTDLAPPRSESIDKELEQVRRSGPLQNIVIPPCPELLARLRTAMSSSEPDLNEVARIATSDVAMSATLLKSANSPLFASVQPVQTIGAAMDRLGLSETASVMSRMLVARAIKVSSPHLLRFWERAAKRSVSMRFLAHKLPGMSPDLAQTYGLFCHVGTPVMMQSIKGYSGTLVEANARIDRSFVATENANHRTDHAVVGALVARVWRLAPAVIAAIRLHHDLDTLGESGVEAEVNTLVALGLVAQYLVDRHEEGPPDVDWRQHGEGALSWLHLGPDEMALWEEELQDVLNQVGV